MTTLWRLLSANLAAYSARPIVAALLPQLGRSLRLDKAQSGWLGSAFNFAAMLAALPFAWLADRLHAGGRRRPLLLIGAALWCGALALAGAGGFTLVLVGQALMGLAQAAMQAPNLALVRDLYPGAGPRRDVAVGQLEATIALGGLLGYSFGALVGGSAGWRVAFGGGGALALIGCAPLLGLVDPRAERTSGTAVVGVAPRRGYGALLLKRTFALDTLAMGAFAWAVGGFAHWMPSFLSEARGVSETVAGVGFGLVAGLCGGGSALGAGLLLARLTRAARVDGSVAATQTRRSRRSWGLVFCSLCAFGGAALVPLLARTSDTRLCWLLIGMLVALLIATLSPSTSALTHVTPASHLGVVAAVNSMVVNAGEGLGRWHIGAVAAGAGIEHALELQLWPLLAAGLAWAAAARFISSDWDET